MIVGFHAQLVHRRADLGRRVAFAGEVCREQVFLDVAVVLAVRPVPEVLVSKLVVIKPDHPILRFAFWFADLAHTNRILPVNSSCIMPCFSSRAVTILASMASISASMSFKTSAIAPCSFGDGSFTSKFFTTFQSDRGMCVP